MNPGNSNQSSKQACPRGRGWVCSLVVGLLASLGGPSDAKAGAVSLLVSVGNLYDGTGTSTSLAGNGLILVVASGDSGPVPNPAGGSTIGGAWSGSHEILFAVQSSTGLGAAQGGVNAFLGDIRTSLASEGSPVALFWFPGKSSLTDTLATGQKFGRYSDGDGSQTGLPWILPASGGTLELQFRAGPGYGVYNTGSGTYDGSYHPMATGEASLVVTETVRIDRAVSVSGDLNFGGVLPGDSATRIMKIRNMGNAILTVSSLSFPPGFQGNWPGGTIPARSGMDVTVTFGPTSGEDYGGFISVLTNATSGPNSIQCSGWGLGNSMLTEAMDGWAWTTGASSPWVRTGAVNHDGEDAGKSAAIGNGQETWAAANFIGPGTVSFWWKVSSEAGSDFLSLEIDGAERHKISGEVDWQELVATIGPGFHEIRWLYRKNQSLSSGADAGWVDEVQFVAGNPPPLAGALDQEALLWTTSGNGPWISQGITTHDGVDAGQSGTISDNGVSWLETIVPGPGTVTFWWKVSSQPSGDSLRFYVNGIQKDSISGEVSWQQRTWSIIGAGRHMLRWAYLKNSTVSNGEDRGWADGISFVPDGGGLSAWASGFGLNGTSADPAANGDGDGSDLLLEYAFNLNPTRADTRELVPGSGTLGLPSIRLVGSGLSARLRIEFLRRTNAVDLIYIPQFGNDLSSVLPNGWAPFAGAEQVTSVGADWERVIVEDTTAGGELRKRFGRVKVEYNPQP